MRLRLLLLAATVVCVLTADVRLQACTCSGPRPPCQAAWYSPIVFVGQVVHIEDVERPATMQRESYYPPRRVTFRVTETLRGAVGETLVVHTGQSGGDCGYDFQRTHSYLVYTHQMNDGILTTGICSRTRRVQQAGDDLAYLRGPAREPSALGTVLGTARMPNPMIEYEPFERAAPYAGGRVVFEPIEPGAAARYEAVTGRDGRYSVKVPVGRYRATLEVREGLYASAWSMPEILDTRGCGEANFTVRPDGRIRGRVLDADRAPVTGLSVDLLPANAAGNLFYSATTRARTDAEGAFEFTRLAPGSYLLGVSVRRDGRNAESTAVWLAAQPGGAPVRVELDPEERSAQDDLYLPESISFARVTGVVLDSGSQPLRGANVYVLSDTGGIAAGPLTADARGEFSFTVVAGRRYRLSAEHLGGPGKLRRVESQPFDAEHGVKPFILRMPAQ